MDVSKQIISEYVFSPVFQVVASYKSSENINSICKLNTVQC